MASRYWVGGGSANTWAAITPTNWSATSGGANNASVPGTTDDVFFDANSPTGTGSVVAVSITIRSLDCTGYTHDITINSGRAITVSGNGVVFKLVNTMTLTLGSATTSALSFTGTSGTTLITMAGLTIGNVTFNGIGGTWQFQDAMISTGAITLTNGTLDINNKDVTCDSFSSSNSNIRTVTLGTSTPNTITITGTGTGWIFTTATNLTFNPGQSTIKFTDTSNTAITFSGGGKTFNNLWFSRSTSTSTLTINGSNTYVDFKDDGTGTHAIQFAISSTQTVTTFTVSGIASHLISIQTSSAGSGWTLSCASGVITCDYLAIRDSAASGGAAFYAGANSTNVSGNSGWLFTDAPISTQKQVIMKQAAKRAAFY